VIASFVGQIIIQQSNEMEKTNRHGASGQEFNAMP
jgi:hypothetical protein